ncbi:two-component sensor histidine kinase [Streptomyces cavourensis]|nr:two-component sensor histidine kinase [Streptomyces cavourensis]
MAWVPALRRWPRTLASRLFLIFLVGLVLAHALSFSLLFYERYQSAKSVMLDNLERDVVVALAILNRLPAAERADWLPRLASSNRQYLLGPGDFDRPLQTPAAEGVRDSIQAALNGAYPLAFGTVGDDPKHIQVRALLADGQPVTLDIHMAVMPLAVWLPVVLAAQLALLILCAWLAVRLAIRPLTHLAGAADAMSPDRPSPRLAEDGPAEVAQASAAFNAMQDRIAAHLAERMQILGAISHDLQTPITRMKLRSEFMDDSIDRDKLTHDLKEVEQLVRDGLAYARSAGAATEPAVRIDLDAFLDSLVCDYADIGKPVTQQGHCPAPWQTRPRALRRVLGNLIDNALKFGGAAEVVMGATEGGGVSIRVLDRGPGIPDDQLQAVLQPFYRLEGSRNRDSGGTGLGLAIAQQLVGILEGELRLKNREGGGLEAEIRLKPSA